MKKYLLKLVAVTCLLASTRPAQADLRSRLATEAAEEVVARFGAKAAGRSVPALARRIESYAARYGEETFLAVRRVGPRAFELADAASGHGTKAMRLLARHGEAGATCVLKRPGAMAQFIRLGEEGASVLVKHPGIAEKVLEKSGLPAVRAMAAVGPRNGRRLAMLLEENVGKSARWADVLEIVARYGDRGAAFVWNNKGALAAGTALTAFVANPEPFINGTKDIAKVAGDATVGVSKAAGEHVVAPVIGGLFTSLKVGSG